MDPKTNRTDGTQNDSMNDGFTAKPMTGSADQLETAFEYGEMNEKDAKESGYTDKEGHAKSMAKKDVEGSPTGAYTDVGHGRSGVVKPHGDHH